MPNYNHVENLSLSSLSNRRASCPFLNRQFGSVWYVYNWALALATTTYQTQGEGITRFQLDKRLTALKQELPWLGEVASQPLQQALVHLDKAFTRIFREKKGYPRFTSKRGKPSATYPQGVIRRNLGTLPEAWQQRTQEGLRQLFDL